MLRKINKNILNTKRMSPIKGVVIHNDYGSKNATAKWYANTFLPQRAKQGQLSLGVAHYYIDASCIARVVDTYREAWHTGNREGNGHYIGYEVCGSRWDNGLSTEAFKANEEMAFRQAAEDMLFYKLPVNRNTVRLHKEFSSTSCPHRSWDLHGKSVNAVKDYFISRIKHYQSLGKTVDVMLKAKPAPKPTPAPSYTPPKAPFKQLRVGDTATIRQGMTSWYLPSDPKAVAKPSKDFTGQKDTVKQIKDVSKSYSKRAYLLDKFNSWVLEQDLEEPRADWEPVKVGDEHELAKDEFEVDGNIYKVTKIK